jgi:hypothetical protein
MKHEMTSTVPDNAIDPNHVKPIKLEDDELDEGEIGRSSPSVLIEDFDRTSVIAGDGTLRSKHTCLANRNTTNSSCRSASAGFL